ncbi:D-glycero-alpha-D-manno-heptose-1,7-bisphosphate 7-phosphatase [Roseivirga sp. BDSF3-8]|uniref:D-glycero-alpha-D-manno-heptose-1,7-bisphosphate 7-phosphatase n=1 Tax=Roseivirga sp. BDSF3-8 TaxID=3241598 RepID=UPI003531F17A
MNYTNKAIFLDRDGVLNRERGEYTFRPEDFDIIDGVPEALIALKKKGFHLVVITNQAGIAKGLYQKSDVLACHELLQKTCSFCIDHLYYAPWHPVISESLSRKPGTLMFERAIARYKIDAGLSYMVGDKERDLIPAKKLDIQTVSVAENVKADLHISSLPDLVPLV